MKFLLKTKISFFLTSIIFCAACTKSATNPTPVVADTPVTISSLSVTSGPLNTPVVINGTGFSSTSTDNQVTFNGKAAIVSSANATQLSVIVPSGAGTGAVTVAVKNGSPVSGPIFIYEYTVTVSTFAGNGNAASVDGLGAAASFNGPLNVIIDGSDNLYVTEYVGCKIRKIAPDGAVTTLAGSGQEATTDGSGISAAFHFPWALAMDATGNIYVAEEWEGYIRKITPTGVVTTIAGDGNEGYKDGPAASAEFHDPSGVAVDQSGNIYIADAANKAIREINTAGNVSTFIKIPILGEVENLVFDASGNLYAVNPAGPIVKITSAGVKTVVAGATNTGLLSSPLGITIDSSGNFYIADSGNQIILQMTPNGTLSQIAGVISKTGSANGIGSAATFYYPDGIAVSKKTGDIYVTDYENNLIRKITLQ